MEKVQGPFCPYCTNVEQTVNHLLVSCPIAVSFWSDSDFITLLQEKIEVELYIATMSNKCSTFSEKISKFIN